jgi:signal transduction histidine kinase
VLTVSLRRHRDSQAQKALDAISAERQRIAQDLHDGLAQDLAFIALHSDRLALDYGSDHPLAIAAQRALAVSRGKILDLEGSAASDTEQALREVARELATRHAVEVDVRADRGRTLDYCPSDRRDLVRIAREAIVNAVKHGGARKIEVTLGSPQSELLLRIADDGRPLEPTSPRPSAGTGLGMQAMRSRAHSLGGRLIAEHHPGGGTEINVVKPNDGSNETVS